MSESSDRRTSGGPGDGGEALGRGSLDRGSLREAALAGVRWVAAGRVAAELLAVGSMVVLARLVTPAEFGRAAIALILVAVAAALTSGSLGAALVQRKELEEGHVRSALTVSLALGAALSVATYFVAPLLAGVFDDETARLVRLISPIFLVSACGIVPHAALQRTLAFRRLASIEVTSITVRSGSSVAFALAGLGASSLVLGTLAGSAAYAGLLIASAPRFRPGWNRRAARDVVGFGVPAAGFSLVAQAGRNVDYAILGARLPAAQVGFYWRAYQLGVEYERKLTTIMTRMALPLFSRAASLEDMRHLRVRMMRMNALAVFGVLSAFVAVAPVLVPWAFGAAWEPSVLPAQIFALAGMATATGVGSTAIVLAAGRPRALLWLGLAFLAVYTAVVFVAAPHGIVTVCVAGTIVIVLRTAALHWLVLDRVVGIPIVDLRHELLPAGAASIALLVASVAARELLLWTGVASALVVLGALLVGGAVYLLVLRSLFRSAWRDVASLAARVLGLRRRATPPVLRPSTSASGS